MSSHGSSNRIILIGRRAMASRRVCHCQSGPALGLQQHGRRGADTAPRTNAKRYNFDEKKTDLFKRPVIPVIIAEGARFLIIDSK